MDPAGGVKSIDNLRAAGNAEGRMYVIPRAGHHGESIFIPWSIQEDADLQPVSIPRQC